MTPFEFSAIVCATSYKPNSKVTFKKIDDLYRLTAAIWVQDIHADDGRMTFISMSRVITSEKIDSMDERAALSILHDLWYRLEMHEVNEHYKYRGRCVKDPHPL